MATFSLLACKTSAGDDDNTVQVVFKDQMLQGTINGKSFTLISGLVEDSAFEEGSYDIELYNIEPATTNPWDLGAYFGVGDYLEVIATVPAKTGRTDLFFNLETGESMMVNLYDRSGSKNTFAHIGAVEITAIDTTAGTITGRIAASNGEGDEVNGNFTVKIAPAE